MCATESQIPIFARSLQVLKIKSFKRLLEKGGENFVRQHYTDVERGVSDRGKRRIQYLAGRWAAKKAVIDILENDQFCFAQLPSQLHSNTLLAPRQPPQSGVSEQKTFAPNSLVSNCCLEVAIVRLSTGQPSVKLFGQCKTAAARLRIKRWLLSIGHTDIYAIANAIAIV